jgi:hypothetical protein
VADDLRREAKPSVRRRLDPHQPSPSHPTASNPAILSVTRQATKLTVLDGVLTRTIPLALTPTQRARLQGARTPGPALLIDRRPTRVQRTVSCRGGTQIIGQRVQVGLRYAGQIVTIEVDETTLRIYDQRDHLIQTVPRTSRKEVRRHKAYGRTTNHTTG